MKLSSTQKTVLFWLKESLCFIAVLITINSCFNFKQPEPEIKSEEALICYPVPVPKK